MCFVILRDLPFFWPFCEAYTRKGILAENLEKILTSVSLHQMIHLIDLRSFQVSCWGRYSKRPGESPDRSQNKNMRQFGVAHGM